MIKTGPETQPPEGQTLHYHGFNLTELFLREDFQTVDEGLRRLFGEVTWGNEFERKRTLEELRGFLERAKTVSLGSAYINLGYVVNAEAKGVVLPMLGYIQLPHDVFSLHLSLSHLLPSILALTVFVDLEMAATEELNAILNRIYSEEDAAMPGGGFYAPETIKARDVQDHLWAIRKSIENLLARYARGVFLSLDEDTLPLCPATDVLSLQHIPIGDDEETAKWLEENYFFLRCIGIQSIAQLTSRYKEYLLFGSEFPALKDTWERKQERAFRLLSSLDLFEAEQKQSGYGSPEGALIHRAEDALRDIGEIHALSELLNLETDSVAELRSQTQFGGKIEGKGTALLGKLQDRFDKLLVLESSIGERSFRLARLSHELKSQEKFIIHDLPEFKPIKARPGREEKPFPRNMLDFMDYRMSLLQNEIRILKERFAHEMALTNSHLNYRLALDNQRLQRRMDRLTIVMTILAVASVVIAIVSTVIAFVSIFN